MSHTWPQIPPWLSRHWLTRRDNCRHSSSCHAGHMLHLDSYHNVGIIRLGYPDHVAFASRVLLILCSCLSSSSCFSIEPGSVCFVLNTVYFVLLFIHLFIFTDYVFTCMRRIFQGFVILNENIAYLLNFIFIKRNACFYYQTLFLTINVSCATWFNQNKLLV